MRALLLLVAAAAVACAPEPAPSRTRLDPVQLLAAKSDPRFARATEPIEFAFPRDHGPHEDFQTEWWYFTGTLADESGGELAYELTFFRRALAFDEPAGDSPWHTRDVYMAHLALADGRTGEFRAFERFERGAASLAGCEVAPWRVWTRDWSASGDLDGGEVRLAANAGELELDLVLRATKPIVLHGERGLSIKSREGSQASYYYSIPRFETSGRVSIGDRELAVRGESWFDREWSSSGLAADPSGWDWFALRFDDGTELMLYRVRLASGAIDAASSGTFVARDGAATHLAESEVAVEALGGWTSPTTGANYPMGWRIRAPSLDLDVSLAPLLESCELDLSVRYWEGAVRASGTRAGRSIRASGFVEMTGY